jgi:hypothetical protein
MAKKKERVDHISKFEMPVLPVEKVQERSEWLPLFNTYIEDMSGEQYLARIEQDTVSRDIRVVRV